MVDEVEMPEDSPGYERTSTLRKRRDLVNQKKLNSTMRKLRRTIECGNKDNMTEWESTFLSDVNNRVNENGSAFSDLNKGELDSPLSILQGYKLREIGREMKMRDKIGMKAARSLVFKSMHKG